jgi:hypothetical protein
MGADRRLGEIGQARNRLLLTVASYHNPVNTPVGSSTLTQKTMIWATAPSRIAASETFIAISRARLIAA